MAKKRDRDVVFRKIRGRVVPIRRKSSGASKERGIADIAAGIALAAGSAYLASKGIRKLAKTQKRIMRAFGKTELQAGKFLKSQTEFPFARKRGFRIARRRRALRLKSESLLRRNRATLAGFGAGSIGGSFLAQRGVEKEAQRANLSRNRADLLGAATGVGFSAATGSFLLHRIKNPATRRVIFKALGL